MPATLGRLATRDTFNAMPQPKSSFAQYLNLP
jgi:hypothetical protein